MICSLYIIIQNDYGQNIVATRSKGRSCRQVAQLTTYLPLEKPSRKIQWSPQHSLAAFPRGLPPLSRFVDLPRQTAADLPCYVDILGETANGGLTR